MAGSDADKLNVDSIIQRLLEGEKATRAVGGNLEEARLPTAGLSH